MPGLTTTPGDGQIGLSWQPAADQGSPITHYVLEISPAPASGPPQRTLGGSATSATITGLANGDTYHFQVEAVNAQGPGQWSAQVSDIPFGKPDQMPAPTASGASVPDPQTTCVITVSWPTDTNDNGRSITGYTVREYSSPAEGGPYSLVTTSGVLPGTGQTSFTVSVGSWYEFTVTATNPAGSSAESPRSTAAEAAAQPDAPGNLTASDHPSGSTAGYDQTIHVSFTVPKPNSAQLSSLQYSLNGTGSAVTWSVPGAAGSTADEAIGGLVNGDSYVVYVRGCNDAGLCGPWAGPSDQVIPYGPPMAPSVTATPSGTSITYSWSGGGGNGRPVGHYHVCFSGGSCEDTGAGSTTIQYGYSQTHTVSAYVVDTAGQQSGTATSPPATTVSAPSMSVSVSQGPHETVTGCTASYCYSVDVTVANAAPNAVLNYACYDNGAKYWPTSGGTVDTNWSGAVVRANGSGAASFQSQCVWGWWGNSSYHLQVAVNGTYSP